MEGAWTQHRRRPERAANSMLAAVGRYDVERTQAWEAPPAWGQVQLRRQRWSQAQKALAPVSDESWASAGRSFCVPRTRPPPPRARLRLAYDCGFCAQASPVVPSGCRWSQPQWCLVHLSSHGSGSCGETW